MMAEQDDGEEGRPGIGRVEAFSDGVIAIIITIMVLELHPPLAAGLARLWALWPVFLAYLLSYAYVAIYWVNHHQLFAFARRVNNSLLWSNMLLLFALSLVPFATAYLGEHHFSRDATLIYLVTILLPALVYAWLLEVVFRDASDSGFAGRYRLAMRRKGWLCNALYVAGLALTFVAPALGIASAGMVAVLWFLPISGLNRKLAGRKRHG